MGCGSSSIANNTPPPIDWSRYEPTGDVSTDQHHVQEMYDLASKHWGNRNLRKRFLNQARLLDPSIEEIAHALAHSYRGEAWHGDQTLKLQKYAIAEQFYSEAHRLLP